MAVMVKKLYKNGRFLYHMKLVAGESGMNNMVQWVHIIEDESVISFLHGNELVFTAGIMNDQEEWLPRFVRKLHEARASACVVNLGPHTHEVPEGVLKYCDEAGLPLFTIPWETRMVDMTRDFCHHIMHNAQVETTLVATMKNILFRMGEPEAQALQMERYGYQRDSRFCFLSVCVRGQAAGKEDVYSVLGYSAERLAKSLHELYLSFTYKDRLILVLVNYDDGEIEGFAREFQRQARLAEGKEKLYIGVSANRMGIFNQAQNFENAQAAMEMAERLEEPCCYYEKLGIYKVLFAVGDRAVLRGFYQETLGRLEAYDRENNTRLMQLLRAYLNNNGSLQTVSEKLYIHRNTVTNQLKKIQSIVGLNPLDMRDHVGLYLGFYIRDIL